MNEPPFDIQQAHHWFAVQWNNEAWDTLERADVSLEEGQAAVHKAHASCCHWLQAGDDVNYIRALCLVVNAEAAFGSPSTALRYSLICQDRANRSRSLTDWDHAFIADASARALAAEWQGTLRVEQGRSAPFTAEKLLQDAGRKRDEARKLGDAIADPQDQQFFQAWFVAGNWHGLGD